MKLSINERGTMLSDYFGGTTGVMLPVQVDQNTTVSEVLEELESEINAVWDHIQYTAEYHGFTGDLDKAIEYELLKMRKYIASNKSGSNVFDSDLDYSFSDDDDCAEYPVCIFTIEFGE